MRIFSLLLHVPCEGRHPPPCKSLTFGCRTTLCVPLAESELAAVDRCPLRWDVRPGKKNVLRLWNLFFWRRVSAVVPKRCAERVRDITDFITRAHAYPDAYGGFSDVWNCELKYTQLPPKRVAVKAIRSVTLNEEDCEDKKKDIEKEISIWAKLEHPNVVPLYGITHGFGSFPALVCPWADNGTLTEYLEKFETQLNMKNRVTLLADIAAGLRYLHSCDIVHGDLSGANVLITKDGRACLADFGLSTLVEQVSGSSTSGIMFPGNIRWAAPELFDEPAEGGSVLQLSSQQADIYSFGCIMLQMLSGKLPFHEYYREAQIVIVVSRGHRPCRENRWDGKAIPDTLWNFIEACWEKIPHKRPSSKRIVGFIKTQISRL